jgi:hypothetical protein
LPSCRSSLTAGEAREKYVQDVERYKKEKEEIKVEADKLEAVAKEADQKSDREMHVHERWAWPRRCCRSPSPWPRSPC